MGMMSLQSDFAMPSKGSILGRKSSITAAFFQAITPMIQPTAEEVHEVLTILGMRPGGCFCAYCGGAKTEWDHFRPTVIDRRPTGFISEIANLVPCCGKCNQSKGNKNWRVWISSKAALAPIMRDPAGLQERIERLQKFEEWRVPVCIDYVGLLGEDRFSQYLRLLDACEQEMRVGHEMSRIFLAEVQASLR